MSRHRLWFILRTVRIESIPITLPLPFGRVTIKLDNVQRQVGWRIFVEMSTRVATQSLQEGTGNLREALSSLYILFDLVRTELKSMAPSSIPLSKNEFTVEGYGILLLNDALRPFLSRWHPRLQRWEATGRPEPEWPLASFCRDDLEATRQRVLLYTRALGQIVGAQQLAVLLPPAPDPNALPKLTDEDTLKKADQMIEILIRG